MNFDPQKKKLGIFAHRWCGHLVKFCPMEFCLREPKHAKKEKLILEPPISGQTVTPAAPNHKIDFSDRWAHKIEILVYKSAQHFFHAVSSPKF